MTKLPTILIRGAGDLATGVAIRLYRAGLRNIIMLETAKPLAVRRTVVFSEAVYNHTASVEEVTATSCTTQKQINPIWNTGGIPLFCDPAGSMIEALQPDVVIDAIIAKKNIGTHINMAPTVIGLGPGFTAGKDVHAVVETKRGHYLGRTITEGSAIPNTGIPGSVNGFTKERVHWATEAGTFTTTNHIGNHILKSDLVGYINDTPVRASISGVLRGLLPNNTSVKKGTKIADIDPRNIPSYCNEVSDKALAVGGAVLEILCARLLTAE